MEIDSYDGRRPAFGIGGHQRGFRSKPGAPMAQPWLNKGAVGSSSSLTPRSNWDSVFRDTASNNFGAGGAVNPRYTSTFGKPTVSPSESPGLSPEGALGQAGPVGSFGSGPSTERDQADIFAPGVTGAPTGGSSLLDNGTHAQAWSQPAPRASRNPLAGGYEAGNTQDILKKYKTLDSTASLYQPPGKKNPFGWFKSFDQNG